MTGETKDPGLKSLYKSLLLGDKKVMAVKGQGMMYVTFLQVETRLQSIISTRTYFMPSE